MLVTIEDNRRVLAAWEKLLLPGPNMVKAEPLQYKKGKAEVWRLSDYSRLKNVIAKRCKYREAQLEHHIYEDLLANMEIDVPEYYGLVAEADERYAWIFVEDISGTPYSADTSIHCELASRWLARLHAAARSYDRPSFLQDVGPAHYSSMLTTIADTLSKVRSNPALRDHLTLVRELSEFCDRLGDRWDFIEDVCQSARPTLVHGSYSNRNMRVRLKPEGHQLMVFDWGAAGWGVPARDMAKLVGASIAGRLDIYQKSATGAYSESVTSRLSRLVLVGRLFRAIEHSTWIVPKLEYDWVDGPVQRLGGHINEFRQTTDQLGLGILS